MRVVAFDVAGPYGHFRKPYAPLSPVTFAFPPPPTVLGLVGAICGYGKEEYHERLGWESARVAVGLRAPARRVRVGFNLLNTKKTDALFRPKADACRMQIPFEVLVDPAFRIVIAAADDVLDDLEGRLKAGQTVYTPTLGLASCLATTAFLAGGEAQRSGAQHLAGVVPLSPGVEVAYEATRPYERLRVPAVMDPTRRVTRYQEVVCAEDGEPLRVAGAEVWEVGEHAFVFL